MKPSIRNFAGHLIANAMMVSGIVKKAQKKLLNENSIITLCFHYPSKTLFESCVNWLSKNGFHFISVKELEKISKGEMAFPKGAVIITVDDGWKSNYDNIVPVAIKNKIPVTIFINPEMVEKGNGYWWSYIIEAKKQKLLDNAPEYYKHVSDEIRLKIVDDIAQQIQTGRQALTIDQVKQISENNLVSIGSHTVSHPILPKCSDEKSAYEILQSKKIISEWTGKEVTHFAYPNGDYTAREKDTLKHGGYTIAFTTNQRYISPEELKKDLYTLPRFLIQEDASLQENICRMMGVWNKKRK